MARQTLLLYTSDMEAAIREVNGTTQAVVTVRLSDVAFVASMRQSFNVSSLKNSSPTPPNQDLDQVTTLMLNAWQEAQTKGLLKEPSPRLISVARRGVAAVALVMESDISTAVLPYMLAGAHLLADRHATDTSRNILTIIFEPFLVTSTDIPGASVPGIPPQIGAPPPTIVASTFMSSWPSAIVFNQRLYCFYRGINAKARQLFYNEFNGSSWTGEKALPNTNTFAGPSAVVFQDSIYCFQQGDQNKNEIWYSIFDGSKWNDPIQVPNTRITAGPSAVTFNNKIYCIHQGFTRPDNALWYNVFDGQTWEGDKNVAGSLITESPSAVVFNNLIYCFHQGAGPTANVLMVNTLNPTTGAWSGSKPVPNTQRMSQGPSAVMVNGKLYCFHQDETGGKLYANVTSDGVEWGDDTLIEGVDLCKGLAATNFNGELLYFYQKGLSGQVKDGEMWYRNLVLPGATRNMAWESSQGEPSLVELKYEDGYKGFIQLAKDMRFNYQADYGYVVYVSQSTLLFPAYADEVRMCLQYSESSPLHVTFSKMFSAEGTFDQRLVSTGANYPPQTLSQDEPRYTLAWVLDWNTVLANATLILFYRARDYSNNPYLWVLFLDRRNDRWIEMQGPRMSPPRTTQSLIGAPTPQFGPASKLYVFYHTETEGHMRYNCLGINNQHGEVVWDVEMVMHGLRARNSPSPICVDQYMHLFRQGATDELRYTTLDTRPNEWLEDKLAYRSPSSVSAVHYLGRIYVFHRGTDAKLAYSIWDKATLEWQQGAVATSSAPNVEGEPTAVVHKDLVYVFYTNGTNLWLNVFNGVAWTGATQVEMTYRGSRLMGASISACVWGDNIHCFFRANDATDRQFVYYKIYNINESTWNDEVILPTASGFFSKAGVILNSLLLGS